MSYKDITTGNKVAKAISARFIKSKGNTPGIEVAFEFEEPSTGAFERLNWVGWLSEKAKENTVDVLVNILDSNGSESVDSEGVFTDPSFINKMKEVSLVIEMEASTTLNEDGSAKSYPKIKWVNNLGGSAFAGCTPDVVKNELSATGFKAAFLLARKAAGKSAVAPPNMAPVAKSELPF